MPELTLPWSEKIKIYLLSLLLILAIYTVIDLYVPIKKMIAGHALSLTELVEYIQLRKKLPIILIFSILMAMRNIKKKTQALGGVPSASK